MRELRHLIVTFKPDSIEYSIVYGHDAGEVLSGPGTKKRTSAAGRMVRTALQHALELLEGRKVDWGGYGTNETTTTDHLIVDLASDSSASVRKGA